MGLKSGLYLPSKMHNFTKILCNKGATRSLRPIWSLKTRKREIVCRSCLHICISTSLNPSFLHQEEMSGKNSDWYTTGYVNQCVCVFLSSSANFEKRNQLLSQLCKRYSNNFLEFSLLQEIPHKYQVSYPYVFKT